MYLKSRQCIWLFDFQSLGQDVYQCNIFFLRIESISENSFNVHCVVYTWELQISNLELFNFDCQRLVWSSWVQAKVRGLFLKIETSSKISNRSPILIKDTWSIISKFEYSWKHSRSIISQMSTSYYTGFVRITVLILMMINLIIIRHWIFTLKQ